MKDGFDEVLRQTRATTAATKAIEAKISSDVWDRQKHWELKREVLFEATRRMAAIEDGLLELDSFVQIEHKEQKGEDEAWTQAKVVKILKWSDTSAAFDETRLFVGVVCGKETRDVFEEFGRCANIIAAALSPGGDWEIYKKSLPDLTRNRLAVRAAVRKELGVDGPV